MGFVFGTRKWVKAGRVIRRVLSETGRGTSGVKWWQNNCQISYIIAWKIKSVSYECVKLTKEIFRQISESGNWLFLDAYYKVCEVEMNLERKYLVFKHNLGKNQEDPISVWIWNKVFLIFIFSSQPPRDSKVRIYGWFMLMFSINQHNTVNQLSFYWKKKKKN